MTSALLTASNWADGSHTLSASHFVERCIKRSLTWGELRHRGNFNEPHIVCGTPGCPSQIRRSLEGIGWITDRASVCETPILALANTRTPLPCEGRAAWEGKKCHRNPW
jgi:hypothetical protein